MTSASEDSSLLVVPNTISSKPWHLTFCQQFEELFIWRNGIRLKAKSGCSVGPVKTLSVLDEVDRTVTVSYEVYIINHYDNNTHHYPVLQSPAAAYIGKLPVFTCSLQDWMVAISAISFTVVWKTST